MAKALAQRGWELIFGPLGALSRPSLSSETESDLDTKSRKLTNLLFHIFNLKLSLMPLSKDVEANVKVFSFLPRSLTKVELRDSTELVGTNRSSGLAGACKRPNV